MKLLSTILLTYILLLTAIPSVVSAKIGNAEHCKKSCCHSGKKQNGNKPASDHNKGCCNNGICNPFMSCCKCDALVSKLQISPSLSYITRKFGLLAETPNSVFLSDIWHPPKVV